MAQPLTPSAQPSVWAGILNGEVAWPIAPDANHVVYTDAYGDYYWLASLTDSSVTAIGSALVSPAYGPIPDYYLANVFSNDQGFAWWIAGSVPGNARQAVTFTADATSLTYTTTTLGTAVDYSVILASHASDGYICEVANRRYHGVGLTGTQAWNWNDGGTAVAKLVYAPESDRFVRWLSGSSTLELRNSSGTQLSTLSSSTDPSGSEVAYWVACTPRHTCRMIFDYSTGAWRYRVLDTTGDVLAWVDTEQSFSTGSSTLDTYEPTAWFGQIAIPPVAEGDQIFWLNPFTHSRASTTTTQTSRTIAAGWYRTFASGRADTSALYAYATTATAPTFLRQRQSPRGNSARVGWGAR